jgi:hypothetical protein
MTIFMKTVAVTCVAALVAIGIGYWQTIEMLSKAHQHDDAKLKGGECSWLLQHLEGGEMPEGRSQGEVAFCVREGHFSTDDLDRAGRHDLVERLFEGGSATDADGLEDPSVHA